MLIIFLKNKQLLSIEGRGFFLFVNNQIIMINIEWYIE